MIRYVLLIAVVAAALSPPCVHSQDNPPSENEALDRVKQYHLVEIDDGEEIQDIGRWLTTVLRPRPVTA